MPTASCENCRDEFPVGRHRADSARFCSWDCRRDARSARVRCERCRAVFAVKRSRADSARYCSAACRRAAGRVWLTCERCRRPFEVIRSRADSARFCSTGCAPNQPGEPRAPWPEGLRARILRALRADGPLSFAELERRLGRSGLQREVDALKDEQVAIRLPGFGYCLFEDLPPALQPRGAAEPPAAPSAEAD